MYSDLEISGSDFFLTRIQILPNYPDLEPCTGSGFDTLDNPDPNPTSYNTNMYSNLKISGSEFFFNPDPDPTKYPDPELCTYLLLPNRTLNLNAVNMKSFTAAG